MKDGDGGERSLRLDAFLASIGAVVLFVCLFYAVTYVTQAPYPGVDYDLDWGIGGIDEECPAGIDWCETNSSQFREGDKLIKIGNLTFQKYEADRLSVPFAGYKAGDRVPVTVLRDGQTLNLEWIYIGRTSEALLLRLVSPLVFLPFWIAGTAVLLLLRPRDRRWQMLVAFNYLTSVWTAVGNFSILRIAGASLVLQTATVLMIPVYLHLHLLVPTPLQLRHRFRNFVPLTYGLAALVMLVNLVRPLPSITFSLAAFIAVAGSLGLLIYRAVGPAPPLVRVATRLMLTGVVLSFGPGLLLFVLPGLFGSTPLSWIVTAVLTLALPLQPFFYIYALYKRHLGDLEFRANRILSFYSFVLLFSTAFIIVFLMGSRWTEISVAGIFYSLLVSTLFIVLALWLHAPFQRALDRLAYGTEHNPDTVIRTFANQIPRALTRTALADLLKQDVSPALLIRQSALYHVFGSEASAVYLDGVAAYTAPDLAHQIQRLLAGAGHYLHPSDSSSAYNPPFSWVRLAIPIQVGGKVIAVWLLGKRDPDDFYRRPDIELLTTLGNQIGVALETARLFEEMQSRATELETAYRDLQRLDQLKDEFVQNVSHELRTPLTFLRGYLDLLLEQLLGPLTSQQREALSTMSDRTEGIIRLVNDIISLQNASIEQPVREPVNMTALVRSCIEALEVTARKQPAGQAPCSLQLSVDGEVPHVMGDRRRLAQVVDNLLGNAIKFSPDGGTIMVELSSCLEQFAANGAEPQPAVALSVRDQGIGIPSNELDRIWQRFYQVDGSSTRRFGGMGLGLAIVRSIVDAHSGRIWVESQLGRGSTFHVVLPVSPPEHA